MPQNGAGRGAAGSGQTWDLSGRIKRKGQRIWPEKCLPSHGESVLCVCSGRASPCLPHQSLETEDDEKLL